MNNKKKIIINLKEWVVSGTIITLNMKVIVKKTVTNILSLDQYFNKIKPYLRDIIIDLQSSDTWKVYLTVAINFMSSKDTEEERVMHSNSDNLKFTSYNDTNEVVNRLLESLCSKY